MAMLNLVLSPQTFGQDAMSFAKLWIACRCIERGQVYLSERLMEGVVKIERRGNLFFYSLF